jgi:hypothetical protein
MESELFQNLDYLPFTQKIRPKLKLGLSLKWKVGGKPSNRASLVGRIYNEELQPEPTQIQTAIIQF